MAMMFSGGFKPCVFGVELGPNFSAVVFNPIQYNVYWLCETKSY